MESTPTQPAPLNKPARVHYIDWLGIFAVVLLVPFHTARVFDIWEAFYVKNAQTSAALSYGILAFLNPWHMPLFFLLAGASIWFALEFRGGAQYAVERVKRLLVPFVCGILVIVPPQAYLARIQHSGYAGSYLQFLADYFRVRGDWSGYTGLFTPGHLWFILFLFVFALAALPLFLRLKRNSAAGFISRLASFCENRGAIFLFILPLIVAGALPDIGGKNPFTYITLFIFGFVRFADERYGRAIDRHKVVALSLGIVIAYFMVQWNASVAVKFAAIAISALLATTLVYDIFVRRINVIRFLFGMKPRHARTPPRPSAGAATVENNPTT